MNIRKISQIGLISLLIIGGVACSQSPGWGNKRVGTVQKDQVESIVKDYILKNPEILVASLQSLQQKQVDDARKSIQKTQELAPTYADDIFHSPYNDPVIGNPKGAVTVVEFFDYQCSHCTHMHPIIDALVKNNADLRVVYKEFPIRGPESELAARAALAAQNQDLFVPFHDALMKATQVPLTEEFIFKTAAAVGLDVNKLKDDMKSKAVNDTLQANVKLGQDLQLIGTPAFFIAKTSVKQGASPNELIFIPGQVDQAQLQDIIKKLQ